MISLLTCVLIVISTYVNGFPEKIKEVEIDYDICKLKSIESFCKLASNDMPTVRQKYNVLIQKMKKISYPFKFYTRRDWNAEPATDVKPLTTPVPYVVIHHTYIPAACNTTEQCRVAMKGMQNYHKNTQGWGDIGYHFCIGSEGGVYEGRGWENLGIHAGKANKYSIGICLIGDWRTEVPPSNQLEATTALIEAGVRRGYLSADYKLVGHSQVMSTECPGDALFHEISTWSHFVPVFEVPQY